MALDANRLGTAIANTIKSFRPTPGQSISDATLVQLWTAVAQDFVDEFQNNADIEFGAADIQIPGLGLSDGVTGAPIVGTANNAATGPLTGKIS